MAIPQSPAPSLTHSGSRHSLLSPFLGQRGGRTSGSRGSAGTASEAGPGETAGRRPASCSPSVSRTPPCPGTCSHSHRAALNGRPSWEHSPAGCGPASAWMFRRRPVCPRHLPAGAAGPGVWVQSDSPALLLPAPAAPTPACSHCSSGHNPRGTCQRLRDFRFSPWRCHPHLWEEAWHRAHRKPSPAEQRAVVRGACSDRTSSSHPSGRDSHVSEHAVRSA